MDGAPPKPRASSRTFRGRVARNVVAGLILSALPVITSCTMYEVSCQDEKGNELYKTVRTFSKKFSLMPIVGIMPYRLIENTQLQPGERRALQFSLPPDLTGKIKQVIIVLRMYEVSDEHQGNIERTHWVSKPIIRKEVSI